MPFAIRRTDTGEYYTKKRSWDEDANQARIYTTSSSCGGSLHQCGSPTEEFVAEVVEIEWRVVKVKSAYTIAPSKTGYKWKADVEKTTVKKGSGFRHVDD